MAPRKAKSKNQSWALVYKARGELLVSSSRTKRTAVTHRDDEVKVIRRGSHDNDVAIIPGPERAEATVLPHELHRAGKLEVSVQRATSRFSPGRWLYRLFENAFLPQDYPNSVPCDYASFQLWDTLQGFCSYVRGMLTSHALMKGIGVGEESASALGAVFIFFVRDISGMLAGVIFAAVQGKGTGFDAYPKHYRLLADTLNNVGLFIDLVAPQLFFFDQSNQSEDVRKKHANLFLVLLCLARVCFAIVGVAGGASRSALTYHFAKNGNNAADLAAKEGSQETFSSLLGMLAGYLLLKFTNTVEARVQAQAQWAVFSLLTMMHMYFNFRAVKTLALDTLNDDRLAYAFDRFHNKQTFPTPSQYAEYELSLASLFDWVRGRRWWFISKKISFDIALGHPLDKMNDAVVGDYSWSPYVSDGNENYYIHLRPAYCRRSKRVRGQIRVCLRGGISSQDRLGAYVHALCVKRLAEESIETALYNATTDLNRQKKLDREELEDLMCRVHGEAEEYAYSSFFSKLKRSGWNAKRVYLKDQEFRYDLDCDLQLTEVLSQKRKK
jgi:hypothetical protein